MTIYILYEPFSPLRNTRDIALYVVDKVEQVNKAENSPLSALDFLHSFTDSVTGSSLFFSLIFFDISMLLTKYLYYKKIDCYDCIAALLWETSDADRLESYKVYNSFLYAEFLIPF